MNKKYDITNLLGYLDFTSNMLNDVGNGLMLTNKEIEVLTKYNIDFKQCHSLKEILYQIETVLLEEENSEDLEMISESISERDYYQNTNK